MSKKQQIKEFVFSRISKKEVEHKIYIKDGEVFEDCLGFGSYNAVEATITNLANYYMAVDLKLAVTKEILIDDKEKLIVLKRMKKL